MARITWRNGRSLEYMKRRLVERADSIKAEMIEALEDAIEQGAVKTQDYLEAAVTKTGLARVEMASQPSMALGGEDFSASVFPGRHVTGNMVGSVSYEVRNPRAREVTGVFGWWGANYEEYFYEQDQGVGNIPAARALPRAYLEALETFRARVSGIIRG